MLLKSAHLRYCYVKYSDQNIKGNVDSRLKIMSLNLGNTIFHKKQKCITTCCLKSVSWLIERLFWIFFSSGFFLCPLLYWSFCVLFVAFDHFNYFCCFLYCRFYLASFIFFSLLPICSLSFFISLSPHLTYG